MDWIFKIHLKTKQRLIDFIPPEYGSCQETQFEKPIEKTQYEKFFGINLQLLDHSIYNLDLVLENIICQGPEEVDFPFKNHKNFQICASTYICKKNQLKNFHGIDNFKQIRNILVELEIMYLNSTYYIENNYQIVNLDQKV